MLFDLDTSEKLASLIAAILAVISFFLIRKQKSSTKRMSKNLNANINNQSVVVNLPTAPSPAESQASADDDVSRLKLVTKILFVDDDKKYKMVDILRKMGWVNTKILTDLTSLDVPQLLESDVVFIDIQGVGKAMHHQDEGLGLAQSVKRRHPRKKVIIYSADEYGQRFHDALRIADYSLKKTAEPVRFEEVILSVLKK